MLFLLKIQRNLFTVLPTAKKVCEHCDCKKLVGLARSMEAAAAGARVEIAYAINTCWTVENPLEMFHQGFVTKMLAIGLNADEESGSRLLTLALDMFSM